MKKLRSSFFCMLVAMIASLAATSSYASDQTVAFTGDTASFASSAVPGPVLALGDDAITFTGVASGVYNFTLTMSGQYLTLSSATMNGISGTLIDTGKWTFLGIDGTSSPSFVLTLVGTADSPSALYSGEMTVQAVPEPGTYALMFAGLGIVGFVAKRRRV